MDYYAKVGRANRTEVAFGITEKLKFIINRLHNPHMANSQVFPALATKRQLPNYRLASSLRIPASMAARIGPPATTNCEPRQARKGAAAAAASGAGVWLVGAATPSIEPRRTAGSLSVALSRSWANT